MGIPIPRKMIFILMGTGGKPWQIVSRDKGIYASYSTYTPGTPFIIIIIFNPNMNK